MKGMKSSLLVFGVLLGLSISESAMAGCQVDLKFKHENEGKTYTIQKVKLKYKLNPFDVTATKIDGLESKKVEYGSSVSKSYTAAVCGKHEFQLYWKSENGNEHSKVVTKDLEDGGNYTFKLEE